MEISLSLADDADFAHEIGARPLHLGLYEATNAFTYGTLLAACVAPFQVTLSSRSSRGPFPAPCRLLATRLQSLTVVGTLGSDTSTLTRLEQEQLNLALIYY